MLSVPVQAILQYKGKDHVTKKVDDRFVQTEVELGVSNEKFVEVIKGLNDGDVVALNPMSLMTEDEKRKAFGSASKGGKKDWGEEGARPMPRSSRGRASVQGRRRSPARPARPARAAIPAKAKAKGKGGVAKGKGGGGAGAFFAEVPEISARKSGPS